MPLQVREPWLDRPGPSVDPPCARSAFSVTITTAADGTWPHIGITRSKNFSAPRSAAKPGLVDDVIGQMQAHPLGEHAARAVRDVGERTAVHDRRRAFRGLHEVRQQRLVEQHHHRADGLEVGGGHRRARRR